MASTKEEVKVLMVQKDEIEKELHDLFEILKKNNADMNEPLVDSEGYPKSNMDIIAIRQARHDIICKRNDMKELMGQIEKGLWAIHATNAGSDQGSGDMRMEESSEPNVVPHRTTNEPFALCDEVTAGSPAAESGLEVGDKVVQFGSLSKTNFSGMRQVAEIVQNSFQKGIQVTVCREGHPVRIKLVPRKWAGQGTLGYKKLKTEKCG